MAPLLDITTTSSLSELLVAGLARILRVGQLDTRHTMQDD